MLSYQHIYHAGNLADVHKHALLAWMLDYMTSKDKPLSFLETHAGRGLYRLDAAEALKTGEAAAGIGAMERRFAPDHPYRRALDAVRRAEGPDAYPGSPRVAAALLRERDSLHLAELHPQEHAALERAMRGFAAKLHAADGFETAMSICPPTPRRGLLLIDPSYELPGDYKAMPKRIAALHRKWNVGVIVLWYPILTDARHDEMLTALKASDFPGSIRHEVRFPPAREGHRMVGSGIFVVNAPFGFGEAAAHVATLFPEADFGNGA